MVSAIGMLCFIGGLSLVLYLYSVEEKIEREQKSSQDPDHPDYH